ncbi:LON peptidase N-terminal domain and RING finger protein 3-like [Pollicipes pollicipes]|uniref:LON peptidase N-terminal domain and RING finger protein 3-like n=1 Tax=Pollicipes pollicipes TaxID=41117 RepID=UPI0018859A2B|nr:LON peptidase N-terminal domain and RING finger protein 3-like [Pollicipes pollicipes]
MCWDVMTEPALQMLVDECLLTITGNIEHGKDVHGAKKSKSSKASDVLPRSFLKKSRMKDTLESLLETSDNVSYSKIITAIASSLLKSSSEILFPAPEHSEEGGASAQQISPNHHDRLKYAHPFSCPICDFVLSEPVTLLCGHTYCKKCLVKWKPNACRLCKRKLYACEFNSSKANVLISNLIKRWWQPELSAEVTRSKGNQSVKVEDYGSALQYYTDALELAPHDHITLSNRSHVLNKLSRNSEALRDAESAIQLQPFWAKGYFRQAAALRSLGRLEDALVAYVLCAALEETPSAVLTELQLLLKRILRRRQHSDGHVSKQRRCSDSEADLMHHSDDSNSSTDVPCARTESRTVSVDHKLLRIMERCHAAVKALKRREGKQHVRTVADGQASRDDFECSLCYRLLWHPTSTPCGHTFCRSCIDRWLDHSPTCPLCKMALDEFLADRGRATTTFLHYAMETLLAVDMSERQRVHEEEMLADSLAGQDLQHEIPVFVCTLAFPTLPCPLHVFEPRYRLMVRRSMESGTREFGICMPSSSDAHGFVDIGVMLEIRDLRYFPDGRSVVDAVGSRRFRCLEKGQRDGYSTARVEFLVDQTVPPEGLQELQTLHDQVRGLVETWWTEHFRERRDERARVVSFFGQMPNVETSYWTLPSGPSWLWWTLAILPVRSSLQLEVLAMTSLKLRLRVIGRMLRRLAPAA